MAAPHLLDEPLVERLVALDGPVDGSLAERKRALRAVMRGRPLPADPGAASGRIAAAALALAADLGAERIAAFLPFHDEPDLRAAFGRFAADGRLLLLPVIVEADAPLRFRPWTATCTLLAGRFGTLHPAEGPDEEPDLLLVPLLAFDRAGRRLGRGGGFYDRTLAVLPGARRFGVAWASREVDAVPAGPLDRPLDGIVTENGRVAVPSRS